LPPHSHTGAQPEKTANPLARTTQCRDYERYDLRLECAMLTRKRAYVDPFDRICLGLELESSQLQPA